MEEGKPSMFPVPRFSFIHFSQTPPPEVAGRGLNGGGTNPSSLAAFRPSPTAALPQEILLFFSLPKALFTFILKMRNPFRSFFFSFLLLGFYVRRRIVKWNEPKQEKTDDDSGSTFVGIQE